MLWKLYKDPSVPRDQVWIRTVGEIFFSPFGLYDPADPAYFSLNDESVDAIRERNPTLDDARFHTVRDSTRPYLLVNSTLIWPAGDLRRENHVGFEYTPLYVGSPFRLKIGYKPKFRGPLYRTVGGGFLEPFAYGCAAPSVPPTAKGEVDVLPPSRPFTLVDASGTSSSAYARALDEVDPELSPHMDYWPVTGAGAAALHSYAFGDGENIENYGLIAVLLRQARRVIVFINTETKLSLDYSPSDPLHRPPSTDDIDEFLPPLFGVPLKEHLLFDEDPFPHNQVFRSEDYPTVVGALQQAKQAGGGAVAVTPLEVQPNAWWGVQGQWEVTVCWVYLDRVALWEQQLDPNIRQDIDDGNRDALPTGPFKHFPNYPTIAEQSLDLVELTTAQVNLLADLSCWTLTNNAERVTQVLST